MRTTAELDAGNQQVLAETFCNLVRYALRKAQRDVAGLGVTPSRFSVQAIEESLAASANSGTPSAAALLARAHQPSLIFHFYWKAPAAREPLEAAFALSYEPDGDLKVRLHQLAIPERIPPLEEAVAELLQVREDGRLAPYPPPR